MEDAIVPILSHPKLLGVSRDPFVKGVRDRKFFVGTAESPREV